MSTFYFSGIEKRATAQVLVQEQASGMMSQLLYSPALLAHCEDIPLVMDSGAYTKELSRQDIEQYAALIVSLGERCLWYANADVIGDQQKSNDNYVFLLSLLPEYLHPRILWIYQQSSDTRYLYEGLEQHQRIGIGGLVPMLKLDRPKAKRRILSIAGIVQQYGRFAHYFGLSVPDILCELHQFGEFSVDSTTWLMGGRYGLLINNQGQQRPAAQGGYNFSTSAILEQNVRTMRTWVESTPKKVTRSPYVQLSLLEEAS